VASLDDNIDLDAAPEERSSGFERFARILAGIGTVWIFALMILIVVDVLGRNFFNSPVTGVAEVAGRSVVAIVFLQIAAAVASKRMTRADFLIRIIQDRAPRAAVALEIAFALLGAVVFLIIAYATWPDFMSSWGSNDFFGVQGIFTIPTWPFWAIVVIGSSLAALAYLLAAREHVRLSL
jgi:TRAP-type C4-dicarboxylate transport system permease small subunit